MATAEQLSALDTAFLELEQAQDSSHMHIGGALVFEPPPDGEAPPTAGELRERIRDRIGLLPRFCKRLSEAQTSPVRWLTWAPMPDFDPGSHVREARLPEPGGMTELQEWLGDFWSHRLDRHRPLWEMTLLTGLEGGRWAIATKTHHTLVDGVGSVDIIFLVLDAFGEVPAPAAPQNGNGNSNSNGNGGRHFLHPSLMLRRVQAVTAAASHPRESLDKARAAVELITTEELTSAPRTSLGGELTAARGYRTAHISIADVKRVRERHGGTLNDVVLTVCAGAIRELMLARGEQPPSGFRAQIPVNIRSERCEHDLGNEVTTMIIELPVEEPDRLARHALITEREAELKAGGQQAGGKAWLDLADHGPPGLSGVVARTIFGSSRMFNVTITNVPGPQIELTSFGSVMTDAMPFVPLFAEHTLGIAIVSYNGGLTFGVCADRHNLPEVEQFADAIEHEFLALLESDVRDLA